MAAILMVDDEQSILELVKNGLQKDGHLVTIYTSAAQVPLDKLKPLPGILPVPVNLVQILL